MEFDKSLHNVKKSYKALYMKVMNPENESNLNLLFEVFGDIFIKSMKNEHGEGPYDDPKLIDYIRLINAKKVEWAIEFSTKGLSLNLKQLNKTLDSLKIPLNEYSLDGYAEKAYCLEKISDNDWIVYFGDADNKKNAEHFSTVGTACNKLYSEIINHHWNLHPSQ